MRRMVLVTAAVLVATVLVNLGAVEDPREVLKGYLLTAEEVGQGWERVDQAIGSEPQGAIAVGALYNKGELQLTSTLYQFEEVAGASEYFFQLKVDVGPNLKQVEEELAEELIIFQSGGCEQTLSFRQGRMVSIFFACPEVDLMRLAKIQLEKMEGGE